MVGLSYPVLADGESGLFDKIIELNLLSENVFAFYMNRNSGSVGSSLTFGGINTDLFVGEINWHPVSERVFWSVEAQ